MLTQFEVTVRKGQIRAHARTDARTNSEHKNDGNIEILASGLISHFLPLICFNMCSHLADMLITTSASLNNNKN